MGCASTVTRRCAHDALTWPQPEIGAAGARVDTKRDLMKATPWLVFAVLGTFACGSSGDNPGGTPGGGQGGQLTSGGSSSAGSAGSSATSGGGGSASTTAGAGGASAGATSMGG